MVPPICACAAGKVKIAARQLAAKAKRVALSMIMTVRLLFVELRR